MFAQYCTKFKGPQKVNIVVNGKQNVEAVLSLRMGEIPQLYSHKFRPGIPLTDLTINMCELLAKKVPGERFGAVYYPPHLPIKPIINCKNADFHLTICTKKLSYFKAQLYSQYFSIDIHLQNNKCLFIPNILNKVPLQFQYLIYISSFKNTKIVRKVAKNLNV